LRARREQVVGPQKKQASPGHGISPSELGKKKDLSISVKARPEFYLKNKINHEKKRGGGE